MCVNSVFSPTASQHVSSGSKKKFLTTKIDLSIERKRRNWNVKNYGKNWRS